MGNGSCATCSNDKLSTTPGGEGGIAFVVAFVVAFIIAFVTCIDDKLSTTTGGGVGGTFVVAFVVEFMSNVMFAIQSSNPNVKFMRRT